ncbi:MAG: HD-GYP domain-containing protein [Chromatiales bacterium]|jgi:HD-GYP domain-containing protein (c-di-GMP phosphodiesterase class II)
MFFGKKHKRKAATIKIRESHHETIPVDDLVPGMFITELDIPWEQSPFLFQGFRLENLQDVEAVKNCCKQVTIDVTQTRKISLPRHAVDERGFTHTTHIQRSSTTRLEISRATNVYRQTSTLVNDIIDDVRLGKAIDSKNAKEAVSGAVDSIIRTPDAMLMLTRIKHRDAYTAEHSLNVAILTIAFGRALGLERDKLEQIGVCGLLHDMGKIVIPNEVLNKQGQLSPEEFEIMKQHTTNGRDIIAASGGEFPGAMDVAHAHHERLDGSGYPRGLYGHQTTLWTKIVAIADTFDAMTSDRVYKEGRTNMDAFRVLNEGRGKLFDTNLVMRFIGSIGIYSPGSLVLLNSGEIGLVVESNPKAALLPQILLLRNPQQQEIEPRMIDLADQVKIPGSGIFYKITKMLRASEHGIDLPQLREQGFLLNQL